MFKKEKDMEHFLICLCDLICVMISWNITIRLPFNDLTQYSGVLLAVIHIALFYLKKFSEGIWRRGYLDEMRAVVTYELQYLVSIVVIVFASKSNFNISRRGIVYFIIADTILTYGMHVIIKSYRKKVYPNKETSKKVYLVTTSDRIITVINKMKESGAWGGRVMAIAVLDSDEVQGQCIQGIPVVANRSNYYEYAKHAVVDEVLVHLPFDYKINREQIITEFEMMGIPVSFNIPEFELDVNVDKRVTKLAGLSVITFSSNFYNCGEIMVKRLIDVIGALVGLVITAIIGIILIPLIKLESKGPAIFSQERIGKNGRVFKFYKFRSMYADAEERKAELMAQNEMNGLMFKMEDDPRITRIGRFIRKTSIDELPQFYNVLIGDMSLVGTRPPTMDEYRQYEAHQKRRLSAKPGLTGMWQVSGRSDITDFNDVVKLDVEYIDNWSVWVDIKILIKTVKVIILGDGAK